MFLPLIALGILCATQAPGVPLVKPEAVVAGHVISGNPADDGSSFTLEVRLSQNDTGTTPIAVCVRVYYDPESVEYVETAPAEVGPLRASGDQKTPDGKTFRTMLTFGNLKNRSLTPVCFHSMFKVKPGGPRPYSILILDETRTGTVPVVSPRFKDIPHRYDNTATVRLGAAGAAGAAPAATSSAVPVHRKP